MTTVTYTGHGGALCDQSFDYQVLTTSFSLTLGDGDWHVIINPSGTLSAGTITMAALPLNGQLVDVRTSQTITTLTISPNSGQSVVGAPATLALGKKFTAIYRAADTTWYFGS